MIELTIDRKTIQITPEWSSANPLIASVDDRGVVTAVSPGTVEIYCATSIVRVLPTVPELPASPESRVTTTE